MRVEPEKVCHMEVLLGKVSRVVNNATGVPLSNGYTWDVACAGTLRGQC